MRDLRESCRVAVIQAAPVMFDKAACTVKAVELIRAAAAEGAELIVFPELFIPGYPYGLTFGFTVGARSDPGREDWRLYCANSIVVPGPETRLLSEAAREAGAYVSIGVSERDAVSGTLYKNITIREPIMVPIATISFRRPVCSTSATLSRSLVTRLRISPALFRSKNRKGSRFSLQEISVRREQVRVSATFAIRYD